jgi:membrane fusion protein, multidrug efflux system
MGDVYAIANFKETQIAGLRPGQPARIEIDAYPDLELIGRVDSFAPASGSRFSLLPPENATGNFTKIVQRVPLKITFSRQALGGRIVTPGMSVVVSIDIRSKPSDVDEAVPSRTLASGAPLGGSK